MYYEDMSDELQDFLSSIRSHLLAIKELQERSEERVVLKQESLEEHLDAIYDDIPLAINKSRGREKLIYSTRIGEKTARLRLYFKK